MLLSPTRSDRRCSLADWLELKVLLDARRVASKGDLSNAFDIADEGGEDRTWRDEATGELLDQEILDEPRTAIFEAAFAELEFRAECLGESYPFSVDAEHLILRANFASDVAHPGQVAYTFCLFASAIREKRLSGLSNLAAEVLDLPIHFQVCACIAAGGYFGGAVSSFGFPRPEGDAFLPALRRVFKRFGYGDPRQVIDPGLPGSTKDGGIDVIAWREHPDKLPSKLYSLGQTASGMDWKNKSVVEDVAPFHHNWFTNHPSHHYIPALYIPFVAYADLDDYEQEEVYAEARARRIASYERRFGIVFDRIRIAHHASQCVQMRLEDVDGRDRLEAVAHWVNTAVRKVTAQGAAA